MTGSLSKINAITYSKNLTEPSPFDLVKLIDGIIAANRKKYKRDLNTLGTDVEITFSAEDHLFTSGVKGYLAIALETILENLVEMISGNGKINIKLERFETSALLSIHSKNYIEKKTKLQPSGNAFSHSYTAWNKICSIISFHSGTIKNTDTPDGSNILIITIPGYLKTERIKSVRTKNHLKGSQILVAAPDSLLKDSIIEALEAKEVTVSRCVSYKEFSMMISSQLFTAVIADCSLLKKNDRKDIISSKKTILLVITDDPEYYAGIANLCLVLPIDIDSSILKLNKLFLDHNLKKQHRS